MKGPVEDTRCTLEEALKSIVLDSPIDHDRWKSSIEHGASDAEIRSTLTFALGRVGSRVSSQPGICQIQTKPKLQFWLGSYGSGEATLKGAALVQKIREVLSIPPAEAPKEMTVLSETVGEEIVESFIPDGPVAGEELVQIEKAVSPEGELKEFDRGLAGMSFSDLQEQLDRYREGTADDDEARYDLIANEMGRHELVGLINSNPAAFDETKLAELGYDIEDDIERLVARGQIVLRDGKYWPAVNGEIVLEVNLLPGEQLAAGDQVTIEIGSPAPQEQLAFSFDYSELTDDKATIVRQATAEIRERLLSIKQRTFEIASRLLVVKSNLDHGQWGRWVAAETEFSVDTADRLVQIGETLGRFPQIAENAESFDMRKTDWYLLSTPTTPDSAREEVGRRAEAGEPISGTLVREVVERHKPTPAPAGVTDEVDSTGSHQPEERSVKRVDAELVAVGKGIDELLRLLKRQPSGMLMANLVQMGYGIPVVDRGVRERLINRTVEGRCEYNWKTEDVVHELRAGPLSLGELQALGCQRFAVLAAEGNGLIRLAKGGGYEIVERDEEIPSQAPSSQASTPAVDRSTTPTPAEKTTTAPVEKLQPRIEDLLKGRMLVVAFTWIPDLPGMVSVGVRVGSDATQTAYETIESSKVRGFPESVQQMIAAQLKSGKTAAPAKAPQPSRAPKVSAGRGGSKKKTSKKPAPKKKVIAAKKRVARKPVVKASAKKSAKKR